ncbi:MAG TPA: LysR family transcriptional regulator [Acidimicrobiia bacterium]|jgi:DNA-binding transcriptional LysR family regulator|nr:LysR family transcriptional regulator [Acidimicrobiia bacterium]
MELRHLETLQAVADAGSFTGAADQLHTVQSNVSEQIRQLEDELGVSLFSRGRRGAVPTEFGTIVLERARHVRRELDDLRADLSMLQGLQTGHATFGAVGTISRWLVPALVADLRMQAPALSLRVTEGASERLAGEVAERELSQAVVTEPVSDSRLVVEHLLDEDLVGLVPNSVDLGAKEPVPLAVLAAHTMILPPLGNPLRSEVEGAAHDQGLTLSVPIEIEGVRLIGDLVAAGAGVSIIPETAVPPGDPGMRSVAIADMPPRRLALVTARGVRLSLADAAVRDAVVRLVRSQRRGATTKV